MVVNNIQDAVRYIESVVATAMNPMGEKMKEIMQNEVNEQIYADHEPSVYERTGQMGEIAQIQSIESNSVVVEFKDNGDWTSAITEEHFFPLIGWEGGSVWKNKNEYSVVYYPPTEIIPESQIRIENEIPQELKRYLISQGLNVI